MKANPNKHNKTNPKCKSNRWPKNPHPTIWTKYTVTIHEWAPRPNSLPRSNIVTVTIAIVKLQEIKHLRIYWAIKIRSRRPSLSRLLQSKRRNRADFSILVVVVVGIWRSMIWNWRKISSVRSTDMIALNSVSPINGILTMYRYSSILNHSPRQAHWNVPLIMRILVARPNT